MWWVGIRWLMVRRPAGRAGRRVFSAGLSLMVLAVVLIGVVGQFQHPADGLACNESACTPTDGNWPTGLGMWSVIAVAAMGAVLTVVGFMPRRCAARK